jgi:hypothetical protein
VVIQLSFVRQRRTSLALATVARHSVVIRLITDYLLPLTFLPFHRLPLKPITSQTDHRLPLKPITFLPLQVFEIQNKLPTFEMQCTLSETILFEQRKKSHLISFRLSIVLWATGWRFGMDLNHYVHYLLNINHQINE